MVAFVMMLANADRGNELLTETEVDYILIVEPAQYTCKGNMQTVGIDATA